MRNIARHGWDRLQQPMGFNRPPQQQGPSDYSVPLPVGIGKRSLPGSASMSPNTQIPGAIVNLCFNVPFNSNLPGPDKEDVLYSSAGAFQRWIHPEGASAEDTPNHALPVHTRNVENLRSLCRQMSESSGERLYATVTSSKPKPVPGMQRGPLTALVTNVCIAGEAEVVHKMRARILNETPITLVGLTMKRGGRRVLTVMLAPRHHRY